LPTNPHSIKESKSSLDSAGAATETAQSRLPTRPQFTSWGRYPRYDSTVVRVNAQRQCADRLIAVEGHALPVGLGRSYGDSGLLKDGTLIATPAMNRVVAFDQNTGMLTAEAGMSLAEILDFAVPRGFFLPVTPGTKYVTLGGAIANDIHGKNHHVAGCFGNHVLEFELVRSDGSKRLCSATENANWFALTIGGLGLTGIITWATVRLIPIVSRIIESEAIQFHGVDEFLDLAEKSQQFDYTVSWIDCTSRGKNFARGVYMQGGHSKTSGKLDPSPKPKLVFPFEAPGFALNRTAVSLFNTVYFHKQMRSRVNLATDYEPFFYPLDKVLSWNRLYGNRGFLQFQCVIPWISAFRGTVDILDTISKSGLASFLSVLKVFGDVPSPGLLSFPKPGVTLALDLPIKPGRTLPLYARLADMTREFGGRLYPAKDAAMTASQFKAFYPQWDQLAAGRDPKITSSFWQRVSGD
jgi:FAD/FMN-containing dehydrogenase